VSEVVGGPLGLRVEEQMVEEAEADLVGGEVGVEEVEVLLPGGIKSYLI